MTLTWTGIWSRPESPGENQIYRVLGKNCVFFCFSLKNIGRKKVAVTVHFYLFGNFDDFLKRFVSRAGKGSSGSGSGKSLFNTLLWLNNNFKEKVV